MKERRSPKNYEVAYKNHVRWPEGTYQIFRRMGYQRDFD